MNTIKIKASSLKLVFLIRKASINSEITIDYGCGTKRTYTNDTDEFYVRFIYDDTTEREITIYGDVSAISIRSRHIHSFIANKHDSLREVNLHDTEVRDIEITDCINLLRVLCNDCSRLTIMNLSDNPFLTEVQCSKTALSNLYLYACSNLRILNCACAALVKLHVSDCTALEDLNCNDNYIDELDLSKNQQLSLLSCKHNALRSLDLKNNMALVAIDCGYNQLNDLDVSNHTVLRHILCKNSCIKNLVVTSCTSLKFIKQ